MSHQSESAAAEVAGSMIASDSTCSTAVTINHADIAS